MNPVKRKLLRIELTDADRGRGNVRDAHGRRSRTAPPVHRGQRAERPQSRRLITSATFFRISIMPDETESNQPPPQQAERRRLHAGRKDFQDQRRGRDQEFVPRLLDVRDHFARAARRARRPQAFAAPHSLRDGKSVAVSGAQAHQVREDLRRHLRQLPSARRSGDLSDARPHGAAVGDAREARGRQGQFRFRRKRSAGGDALHRGAADASRRGC